MVYQNGAINGDFSNCVGGCGGEFVTACYQGCLTHFECAFGASYTGPSETCATKIVDVRTYSCGNNTGLVFNSALACCCVFQTGAGCGEYGTVNCDGTCSDETGGGGEDQCEGESGDGTQGAACSGDGDCSDGLHCDLDACICGGDTDPIMIDTGRAGYLLTGLANGVKFDILADGHPKQIAWTLGASSVGFLALDRNGDGVIDSGRDLFTGLSAGPADRRPSRPSGGAATPRPTSVGRTVATAAKISSRKTPGTPKNGFAALARFDLPINGGNGDGKIDANDAVYSKLVVWIDGNHDGKSGPAEVFKLSDLGITAISLSVQPAGWNDAHGNLFSAMASFVRNGETLWAYAVDLLVGN